MDISFMAATGNVQVNNSEWNKEVTPKKTTSKSPQVRRSSRLGCDKNQSAGGCSARKLFGHGSSQPTQTSVVGDNVREGSSNTPVVDDDYFDEEHWYDELVIQVENKEVDECHPVEDHEAVVAYNTDEDNEDTKNDNSGDDQGTRKFRMMIFSTDLHRCPQSQLFGSFHMFRTLEKCITAHKD
ncbi:uncharacterized protein LOC113328927 isoform X2 [Papaver somniferum]|uniref:uncharacterized protein LOC113328927 isoform X2 n=1 Tax=Papaver somniferum TaxID=3469 RepID=UPI000E705210|nr:uncharacterized protein LOC113328927 isoform X2 [Papaver somniferum]